MDLSLGAELGEFEEIEAARVFRTERRRLNREKTQGMGKDSA